MSSEAKIFKCLVCGSRFSLVDVGRRFFPSTNICKNCYKEGQEKDWQVWCFGKTDVKKGGKLIQLGYNSSSSECKKECPDRNICKVFALNWKPKIKKELH